MLGNFMTPKSIPLYDIKQRTMENFQITAIDAKRPLSMSSLYANEIGDKPSPYPDNR